MRIMSKTAVFYTWEGALERLSAKRPLFLGIVHHLIQDGKSTVDAETLTRLNVPVEREPMDEETAVMGAILAVLGEGNRLVKVRSDVITNLVIFMHIVWVVDCLVEEGMAQYREDTKDEYGFPAFTLTDTGTQSIVNLYARELMKREQK